MGFTVSERRSRRHPAQYITDADYADDIALLSDTADEAQVLLSRVEEAAKIIGLHINETKTEFLLFNHHGQIRASSGEQLKHVNDFMYLGSRMSSCSKDIDTRKAKAWSALNKMQKIWKSTLSGKLKVQFFRATVESVLTYGSECWTLTEKLTRDLDGCYTRLLRAALNIQWQDHVTNEELYGDIPRLSSSIQQRRMRFCGHSWRSKSELVHDFLLWNHQHGKRSPKCYG